VEGDDSNRHVRRLSGTFPPDELTLSLPR